ncbi:HIT domain-containing protein [Candidatus Woesearchaeota archaeon]|nr:HIT domain-containing protein [Candidatus Woesearchaeota archaeon]
MTEFPQPMQQPMTPEQSREMQKQQCIFCQIVGGRVMSKKIYEDDKVMAILDINPANPGHILVFPKEHYPLLPMMPDHAVEYLFRVVKKLSRVQIAALKCDGNNIYLASGAAAGQKVAHAIVHLIPRKAEDGIDCFDLVKNQIDLKDQESLRRAIHSKVVHYFGVPDDEFAEELEGEAEENQITPAGSDRDDGGAAQEKKIVKEENEEPEGENAEEREEEHTEEDRDEEALEEMREIAESEPENPEEEQGAPADEETDEDEPAESEAGEEEDEDYSSEEETDEDEDYSSEQETDEDESSDDTVHMFEIPPPDPDYDKHDEEYPKGKKGPDLDKIAGLFK